MTDIGFIETMAGLATITLGWAALRVVSTMDSLHSKADINSDRLSKIEGRLENGFKSEIDKIGGMVEDLGEIKEDIADLKSKLKEHADGEEDRIIQIYKKTRREDV